MYHISFDSSMYTADTMLQGEPINVYNTINVYGERRNGIVQAKITNSIWTIDVVQNYVFFTVNHFTHTDAF